MIGEQPQSIVNLKGTPETDRMLWCVETVDQIGDQLDAGEWLTVHRMQGPGNFIEYRVRAAHVVSYTVYS